MSWSSFTNPSASDEQVHAYGETVEALHAFHDVLAAAAPDVLLLEELTADLQRWTSVLAPMEAPETERLAGRIRSLPVRGHLAVPPVTIDRSDDSTIEGTVTFGTYFMGGGQAAHGGAIATVFDEVLGALASVGGRRPARTAYLRLEFRSVVPIHRPIRVRAWFESEEGRKRFVRGEMRDGETLCAEVDSLFVELRDGAA